jgi:membrane associated rhomboid family serine protease
MVAFVPWAGLVVGLISAAVVHQFGSEGTFDHCRTISPGPLLVVAAIGILACVASGLASWRGIRGSDDEARRVVGVISAGMAALFIFAILLAMIASLVLPPCFQ